MWIRKSNLILWARTYTKNPVPRRLRFICNNRYFLTNHLVRKRAFSNVGHPQNSHVSYNMVITKFNFPVTK